MKLFWWGVLAGYVLRPVLHGTLRWIDRRIHR
jgi:hypothetical protein